MDKKICFDCNREIPSGREVRLREDGFGWGIGGGRWGGWGGGGGWGTSGDAAFLWICVSCYRKRKQKRLIIILIISGIFLAIFLGILMFVWIGKRNF